MHLNLNIADLKKVQNNNVQFSNFVFNFFYLLFYYYILTVLVPHLFVPFESNLLAKIIINLNICLFIAIGAFFENRTMRTFPKYLSTVLLAVLPIAIVVTHDLMRFSLIIFMTMLYSFKTSAYFNHFFRNTLQIGRGKIAGAIAFLILPIVSLLSLMPASWFNSINFILIASVLNVGLFVFQFFKRDEKSLPLINNLCTIEKRTIILYLIPWIIFSVINVTLAQDLAFSSSDSSTYFIMVVLQAVGVTIGAVVGGFVADFVGRRAMLISAILLYGTSSIIAGLVSEAVFLFRFINGASWGILFVLYIFIIFGDLSNSRVGSKIYPTGIMVYFFSVGLGVVYQPILSSVAAANVISFLMFVAIVPILFAPEILPKDHIEKMKIQKHLKALKKVQKKN